MSSLLYLMHSYFLTDVTIKDVEEDSRIAVRGEEEEHILQTSTSVSALEPGDTSESEACSASVSTGRKVNSNDCFRIPC